MSETSGSPDILQDVISRLPDYGQRRSHDLMRWGLSQGVGVSVTGLSEVLAQYMKNGNGHEVTTARNSSVRQISAGPAGRFAKLVDRRIPGLMPSHLTKGGKIIVEGAAALIALRPDHPVIATVLHTVGNGLDAGDGALARYKGLDCLDGMIDDVRADLKGQQATLSALSIVAMRRGNRVAAANYALATMLTPLSAYTRAQAESRGLIVAEGGIGTRVGRAVMSGAGIAFNKSRTASDILSGTLAVGTADTVLERRDVVSNGPDSKHCIGTSYDPDFMQEASMRLDAISSYADAGLAIGSTLLAASMSDSVQELIPKVPAAA